MEGCVGGGGERKTIRLSTWYHDGVGIRKGYLCQAFLLLYCNPSKFQIPLLLCPSASQVDYGEGDDHELLLLAGEEVRLQVHAGELLPRAAPADMRVSAGWLRRKAAAPKQEEEEMEEVHLRGKVEQGVMIRVGVLHLRLAAAQWLRRTSQQEEGNPRLPFSAITPYESDKSV